MYTCRRFCKGGEIQSSPRVVTANSSTAGETNLLRARVEILKMREEASPKGRGRPEAEKAKKRRQADVVFVEDGPEVVVVKKNARVTTADEGEEIGSGGSSFKSPRSSKKSKLSDRTRAQGRGESGSDNGEKSRILLGRGFDKNVAAKGTLFDRSQREERSRTEATTSLGHREAWMVDRSSSAGCVLPQAKVSMEISMELPTGQRAYVVYRVGANTEMKKVVDKVHGIFSVITKAIRILSNM